jgi:hypothetical protein
MSMVITAATAPTEPRARELGYHLTLPQFV